MENNKKDDEQKLADYASKKIQEGVDHDEIKKQLHAVGWSDEEVDSAYVAGLVSCGIPLPDKNAQKVFSKKTSTVEIVVNFFSFILLGIFAVSLGVLLYGVINYFFQDKLINNYYNPISSAESIHYAIASLIISFPLYYFAMRFWFGRFEEDELKAESNLTKWITYLVLLIAAITLVGDLIVVIFSMLQGEISVRFFLKALTILMIAGGVFGFYFLERKRVQYKKDIAGKIFVIFGRVTMGIVIISIILGFFASGSPKTGRMRSFDNIRANDLATLANCIGSYANEHKALPDSLSKLMEDTSYNYCASRRDPETNAEYEYDIINKFISDGNIIKGEFELCADFSLNSENSNSKDFYPNDSKWSQHSNGRECDKETVTIENRNIDNFKFDTQEKLIR